MTYTRIQPLSETELGWALRSFEKAGPGATHWVPAEFEAIEAERLTDARFRTVADYIFRFMYRDAEYPPPSPDDVDHATTVFQRIAPQWWRSMGIRIFR